MFRKSEEQDLHRFRGALAKEREEARPPGPAQPPAASTPTAQAGPATPAPAPAAPTARPPGSESASLAAGAGAGASRDGQEVESLVGERTSFEGTLTCEGSVRVLGTVQGELQSKATIFIEDKARVTARVTGAQVAVGGRVDGQIFCDGRVEIRPTGRVTGEINAGVLVVHEGAFFDGSSKMAKPAGGAAAPAPPRTREGSA